MDRGCRKLHRLHELISPYFEADQGVWPEGLGNWNVCGIAALGDQDTADARNVVARIEGIPAAADIGFEPGGKIPCGIGRRHAYVTEIAGAISRWNVHAAAERDCKVRVIAADALALVENFPRRHGRACVLVTEGDVAMNEVANRMDPRPARCCLLKQLPCNVGKPVGLAVAAAKQIDYCLSR